MSVLGDPLANDPSRLAAPGIGRQTLKMASKSLRKALGELTRDEKLELVEELWDEIATDRDVEPAELSATQQAELMRRIRELDEDPDRAIPWEVVRERLWKRIRG
ncbi:MAG: addiction module protein [Myxococcota bacterium]